MVANTYAFFKGLKKLAPKSALRGQTGCPPLPVKTANAVIDYQALRATQAGSLPQRGTHSATIVCDAPLNEIRTIQQGDLVDLGPGNGVLFTPH